MFPRFSCKVDAMCSSKLSDNHRVPSSVLAAPPKGEVQRKEGGLGPKDRAYSQKDIIQLEYELNHPPQEKNIFHICMLGGSGGTSTSFALCNTEAVG